jgi:hypothetical protein
MALTWRLTPFDALVEVTLDQGVLLFNIAQSAIREFVRWPYPDADVRLFDKAQRALPERRLTLCPTTAAAWNPGSRFLTSIRLASPPAKRRLQHS